MKNLTQNPFDRSVTRTRAGLNLHRRHRLPRLPISLRIDDDQRMEEERVEPVEERARGRQDLVLERDVHQTAEDQGGWAVGRRSPGSGAASGCGAETGYGDGCLVDCDDSVRQGYGCGSSTGCGSHCGCNYASGYDCESTNAAVAAASNHHDSGRDDGYRILLQNKKAEICYPKIQLVYFLQITLVVALVVVVPERSVVVVIAPIIVPITPSSMLISALRIPISAMVERLALVASAKALIVMAAIVRVGTRAPATIRSRTRARTRARTRIRMSATATT